LYGVVGWNPTFWSTRQSGVNVDLTSDFWSPTDWRTGSFLATIVMLVTKAVVREWVAPLDLRELSVWE